MISFRLSHSQNSFPGKTNENDFPASKMASPFLRANTRVKIGVLVRLESSDFSASYIVHLLLSFFLEISLPTGYGLRVSNLYMACIGLSLRTSS